jgi:hypothetical protein
MTPIFALLHFEFFDHAFVFDVSSCCAVVASALAFLASLVSPLLLLTCSCWGGGFSFFF